MVNPVKIVGYAFVLVVVIIAAVFLWLILEPDQSGPIVQADPGTPRPSASKPTPAEPMAAPLNPAATANPSPAPTAAPAPSGSTRPTRATTSGHPTGRAGPAPLTTAPGDVRIRLTRKGDLDPRALELEAFPSLDRTGRAGSILGRIEGPYVAGRVEVLLGRARGTSATIQAENTFQLGPTVPGRALLAFQRKGEPTVIRAATFVEGQTHTVSFQLGAPGRVVGQVTDSAGQPLYGVRVQVDDHQVRTDRDGRFALDSVVSGRAVLYAELEERVPYRTQIQVTPGKTAEVPRIPMESARTFSGTVCGLRGDEIQQASLFLLPRDYREERDRHVAYERLYHLRLDTGGGFTLPFIPENRNTSLLIYHPRYQLLCNPVTFRDNVGYDPGIELRLRSCLEVRVTDVAGHPVDQVHLATNLDSYDHSAYFRLVTRLPAAATRAVILPNVGGRVDAIEDHGGGKFSIYVESGFPFVDVLAAAPDHLPRILHRLQIHRKKTTSVEIQLQKPDDRSPNVLLVALKGPRDRQLTRVQLTAQKRTFTAPYQHGQASLRVEDLPHGTYTVETAASGYHPIQRQVILSGGTGLVDLLLIPDGMRKPDPGQKQFNSRPRKK